MGTNRSVAKIVAIVLIIYLLTVVGAGICHSKVHKKVSGENIAVSAIRKVNEVDFGTVNTKIYFTITNNGVNAIEHVVGNISVYKKSNNKLLCSKKIDFYNFSGSSLEPHESEEFYLFLYDISEDRGGVENYDEIYNANISDLKLSFESTSLNTTNDTSSFTKMLGIILSVPTYMIGALLVGILFKLVNVGINSIPNAFVRVLLIIAFFPIWLIGATGGKPKKKKKNLTEAVEELISKLKWLIY